MKILELPPLEKINKHLSYNPTTGLFTWLIGRPGIGAGKQAGRVRLDGYVDIKFEYIAYLAHRLAWLFYYGEDPKEKYIDHINLVKDDNRIINLRTATSTENSYNKAGVVKSISGIKGVHWNKRINKWDVKITHDGKNEFFGSYSCIKEAEIISVHMRKKLHGEFANFEVPR